MYLFSACSSRRFMLSLKIAIIKAGAMLNRYLLDVQMSYLLFIVVYITFLSSPFLSLPLHHPQQMQTDTQPEEVKSHLRK